ncbi:MAG: N-6 DNA methylase [Phycisphaera sp.]|nr:N-6 DNA methylase [Phycisphaera sp.]
MPRGRVKTEAVDGGLFVRLPASLPAAAAELDLATEPGPASLVSGDALVAAHLASLDAAVEDGVSLRARQGSHYTPPALVAWVLEEAMRACGAHDESAPTTVLDPACGAGNFLVAAAVRLAQSGRLRMVDVLATSLFGVDVDAGAVELCRARLRALVPGDATEAERAAVDDALARHIVVGDALDVAAIASLVAGAAAPLRGGAFDLVIGNPPFLNQLERATAASRARAEELRTRTKGAFGGYADLAGAFLLEALRVVRAGGAVGFVMPQSFLAAADTGPVRARALECAQLRALWAANERLFDDASVRVTAVVLVGGHDARPSPMRRAFGADFKALPARAVAQPAVDEPWSPLLSDALGVPTLSTAQGQGDGDATIGGIARATADFRDQFYGLRGVIRDLAEPPEGAHSLFPRLVSTRHVDLAREAWGAVDARILGARHRHPRVDLVALAEVRGMAAWAEARLVPKVIVATQTKVIEAVVDERGELLPLVPLITVTLRAEAAERGIDLWMLAAAIASPVVVARAAARYYGTALSGAAIKLSARQLLEMPLPSLDAPWRASAVALRDASRADTAEARRAALGRFARASCEAHALAASDAEAACAFWLARCG